MMIILLLFAISVTNSKWVMKYDQPLPQYSRQAAAGSYNGSIFILGGSDYQRQLLEYNNDSWIEHGMYALPSPTWGGNDYYTQINHLLYMISRSRDRINTLNVYNMDTNIFISDLINVTTNHSIWYGCITSTHNTLFIMGGYDRYSLKINTVSILLLDTMEWLNNVPSMQINRAGHSCNIDPDTSSLYAIGGWSIRSVEMINIDNIIQNTWHILEDKLYIEIEERFSWTMSPIQSIYINNKIYVFQCSNLYNEVNIISTKTQSITIVTEALPLNGYFICPAIVFDNVIYLLNDENYWLINDLTIPTKNIYVYAILGGSVFMMGVVCGLRMFIKRYFKNENEMEKIPKLADDASTKEMSEMTNQESEGKHEEYIQKMININGEMHQYVTK